MLLSDFSKIEISNFRGPQTAVDAADVPLESALEAQNVEYQMGAVRTRYGYGEFWNGNIPISSIFNWIKAPDSVDPSGNYLVYTNRSLGTANLLYDLDGTKTAYGLFTQSDMAFATNASFGKWVYSTPVKSDGTSAGQVRVSGVYGASVNTDTAFLRPLSFGPVVTIGGSGLCTKGTHRFGYRVLTRSGYLGPLCPVVSGSYTPEEKTLTVDSSLTVSVTPADVGSRVACTVDSGTNTITASTSGISNGDRVTFIGDTQPIYLIPGVFYYVINKTVSTFQVSSTLGGAAVTVGSSGANVGYYKLSSYGWSPEVQSVYLCMTPASNLNKWFQLPDASTIYSSTTVPTFAVNISDADLEVLTEVTDQQSLWSQDSTGVGPFNPTLVINVGSRMGYVYRDDGISYMAFSEPEKPQHLTRDQHVKALPGRQEIISAFVMPNGIYALGPTGTYYTSDTGDIPALWPAFTLVDGRIGTHSVRGVSANTSQGYAWVAAPDGLWLFQGGAYPDKPATYFISDQWRRINWAAAAEVEVVDFPGEQRVRVKVPLDGSSLATHLLTIDYTNGTQPHQIALSLDVLTGVSTLGAICSVQSPTTRRPECWVSSGAAGKLYRQKNDTDTNPWQDDGTDVAYTYETSLVRPTGLIGAMLNYGGIHLRASGESTLAIAARSLHARISRTLRDVILETGPGVETLRRFYMVAEGASFRFTGQGRFLLSSLCAYYQRWSEFR